MTARGLTACAIAALTACRGGPEPCASASVCGAGYECLANRCTPRGGDPVRSDAIRLVLEPEAVVAVAAGAPSPLVGDVTFGGAGTGGAAMFLRFAPEWSAWERVESAFLLLEPTSGTLAGPADVEVVAWRVREPWTVGDVTWTRQPDVAPPSARGIARGAPPITLRVDVTALVRHARRDPRAHLGIALKADAGAGHGATFATGATSGGGPRLEVYVHGPRGRRSTPSGP